MQKDSLIIPGEIIQGLRRLETPLREKSWRPILEYLSRSRVTIKGTERDPVYLAKLLGMQTSGVRHLEVVVEQVLESRVEPDRIELKVRAIALGRRIESDAPDGVVMDSGLVFLLRDGKWHAAAVTIDCPPEWAQWNSRPNSRAKIHYGDPAWWAGR